MSEAGTHHRTGTMFPPPPNMGVESGGQIHVHSGALATEDDNPARSRTCISDFPPEILAHIFAQVDTATLLSTVPHVCRDWRDACAHDVYGPKVRLALQNIRQVLRIRPECLALWVAATMARFAWVCKLNVGECDVTDGVLECAGSLQRLTSLDLSGCAKNKDAGLLTSLDLSGAKQQPCSTAADTAPDLGARQFGWTCGTTIASTMNSVQSVVQRAPNVLRATGKALTDPDPYAPEEEVANLHHGAHACHP